MDVATAQLCLCLHSVPELEDPLLARMLLHSGSPEALAEGGRPLWCELGMSAPVSLALSQALQGKGGAPAVEKRLAKLVDLDAQLLAITDARYPPLLRGIHDPPPFLYVLGDPALLAEAQLAMVGSRKASPAGLRAAGQFAGQATRAGLHITSGLARGIDGASHQGALSAGGRSIAVVATGVDRIYPSRHQKLARELARSGCLVSEFAPGMPPLRQNFPRRNRIISGLSLGVLVVEAALPSGSLITARTALEQGREVFALPWSVYHAGGAGCLCLIRDGGKMVETIEHVLEELGPMYALQQELLPGQCASPVADPLSEEQQRMLELVGFELVTVDELSRLSALPAARVMAELSSLELQGVITRQPGGYIRT